MGTIYKNGVKFSGSGGSMVEANILPEIGEELQKLNYVKINGDSYVLNSDYVISSEEEFIHLYNNVLKDAKDYAITTILFTNDITLHASVAIANGLANGLYTNNSMSKKRYVFDLQGHTFQIDSDSDLSGANGIGYDTFTWKNGNIRINKNSKYILGIRGKGENLNIYGNRPETSTGNSLIMLPSTLNNCVVNLDIYNRDGSILSGGTWNNSTITIKVTGAKANETTPLIYNKFNDCLIQLNLEATDKSIVCFTGDTKNCRINVTLSKGPNMSFGGGTILVKRGGKSEGDLFNINSTDTHAIEYGFIGMLECNDVHNTGIYIDTYDYGGIGFYKCNFLTNCRFSASFGGSKGGSPYYGFKECTSLLNCTSAVYSAVGGNAYFDCTRLINCSGGVDSNVSPSELDLYNSDRIAAFRNCYGLYMCQATSEAGGPPSDANRYAYLMCYASLDGTNHAANTQAGGYNSLDFTDD